MRNCLVLLYPQSSMYLGVAHIFFVTFRSFLLLWEIWTYFNPFLLSLMVHSSLLSEAFLTCLMRFSLMIELPNILQTLMDAAMRLFLCSRSGVPLMFSHCFILIRAKSEIQKWTICYGFRLFLRVQGMYFSFYWYFLLNTLPSSPPLNFDLSLRFTLFPGRLYG